MIDQPSGRIGRADPHIHTTASDGLVSPHEVLTLAEALSLDVIAITDHDTLRGAQLVQRLAREQGSPVDVIVGIEVTTAHGRHLLGLFLERPIPMHRSIEWSISAIVEQGGIALAPHPLSPLTPSLGYRTITGLIDAGLPLQGVETINPTPAGRIVRRKVARCNQEWKLAEFGGSDAHFGPRVGTAITLFDGRTAADFRQALLQRSTLGRLTDLSSARVPPLDYVRQFNRSMVRSPARKLARRVGLMPQEHQAPERPK